MSDRRSRAAPSTPSEAAADLDRVLPLSPVAFHMLVALAEGPRHGYAIAREVEALTEGRLSMGPGTLYGSLQRMLEAGLIREAPTPDDARGGHSGRRRYYALTPLGREALAAESARLLQAARLAQVRLGGA